MFFFKEFLSNIFHRTFQMVQAMFQMVQPSHSQTHGHRGKAVMHFLDKFYDGMPPFTDIFDEDSFYTFAACFTLLTCLTAFVASRYGTV
jgi:hypothetical protein